MESSQTYDISSLVSCSVAIVSHKCKFYMSEKQRVVFDILWRLLKLQLWQRSIADSFLRPLTRML